MINLDFNQSAVQRGSIRKIEVGDKVFHEKFGGGKVTRIEGNKLTIHFKRVGERKVIDTFVQRGHELTLMPYKDYLQTPEWQEKRRRKLDEVRNACQVCASNKHLHVHHRTYANRGHEELIDLLVLCGDCHKLFHEQGRLAMGGYA